MTMRMLTIPDATYRALRRRERGAWQLRAFGLDWRVTDETPEDDGMTTLTLQYEEPQLHELELPALLQALGLPQVVGEGQRV